MKKYTMSAFAAIILVIFSLFSVSCQEKEVSQMTNDESKAILYELVETSQLVNRIFFGSELKFEDENAVDLETVTGAQYYEVASDSVVKSIAELKALAESVYSKSYLKDIYAMAFEGYSFEDSTGYKIDYQPRFSENREGRLCIDISNNYDFSLDTVIDIESANIVEREALRVVIELDFTKESQSGKMKLALVYQTDDEGNGKWLLDSPTY